MRKSRYEITLHVSRGSRRMTGLRDLVSRSLWQPAGLAVSQQGGRPRWGLPGTQRGQCSRQVTKVGPTQGDARSTATQPRSQLNLAQCLHPHSSRQDRGLNSAKAQVPSYRRQRTDSPPHKALLIIRKKPKGLIFPQAKSSLGQNASNSSHR